jgi:hypothetical protein
VLNCITPPCGANACDQFTQIGSGILTYTRGSDYNCSQFDPCDVIIYQGERNRKKKKGNEERGKKKRERKKKGERKQEERK